MRLIHSFRVLGACLSCLQVYKEALNIDVSYKKAVFRAFFCFLFPLQEGRRILYLFTFHPTFFSTMFFPYSYIFPFILFPSFFFRLLIFPFILLLFFFLPLFVCSLMCCSAVVLQSHTTLVNYSSIYVRFSFSLHRLIYVYIIYNIILCICVYINRDIHYTYYTLIYSQYITIVIYILIYRVQMWCIYTLWYHACVRDVIPWWQRSAFILICKVLNYDLQLLNYVLCVKYDRIVYLCVNLIVVIRRYIKQMLRYQVVICQLANYQYLCSVRKG